MSVVIADFQNNTKDPTFNNTLGLTVKRALEGAGFITAFDRTQIVPRLVSNLPRTLMKRPHVTRDQSGTRSCRRRSIAAAATDTK